MKVLFRTTLLPLTACLLAAAGPAIHCDALPGKRFSVDPKSPPDAVKID